MSAAEAETRWVGTVEDWRSQTKAKSLLVRDPGTYVTDVDAYAMTGRAHQPGSTVRQPLSAVLDAAAPLTGRDVAAAGRAFAGTTVCGHCHR
ncbi:hypothetical protein [Kitasatospora sp. GP82]|uniref:hypothetical protein n=1 Tax=Kitasatospora sp. GP82 TaxID=3035089 RepID=UPI002473B4C0|nr:hypothetical protein [Kitasatospora sp. GP82]MDH6129815.1 hypothetical protein [Kitasatospora sp. GP82]